MQHKTLSIFKFFITIHTELFVIVRAGDRHLFFADPDPAFFLNADPDPAAFLMRIRIQLKQICEKLPYEEFSGVEKDEQKAQKYKTHYCIN